MPEANGTRVYSGVRVFDRNNRGREQRLFGVMPLLSWCATDPLLSLLATIGEKSRNEVQNDERKCKTSQGSKTHTYTGIASHSSARFDMIR